MDSRANRENYLAALREAEAEARGNNYLGVNLGDGLADEYDAALDKSASAEIAQRARSNKEVLSTGVDFRSLKLKTGHESRPLWVVPTGQVYLETFSPYFALATDFLVAIAEPESRPEMIHHYKLSPYSLYAAVSVNLDTKTIINTLDRLSKVAIPQEVVTFIERCTESHGKAKLVLKRNRLFVESLYPHVLKQLLKIKAIREAQDQSIDNRLRQLSGAAQSGTAPAATGARTQRFIESKAAEEDRAAHATDFDELDKLLEQRVENIDVERQDEDEDEERGDGNDEEEGSGTTAGRKRAHSPEPANERTRAAEKKPETVLSFEVRPEFIEQVKEAAMSADFPLMEEYDFRRDEQNPNLPINLRPSTKVRPYQEKSLAKMFGNGRARSGIIVLPCGAGKTLTGITAACTIKKSCIIFCINAVGVEQWIRSLHMFTTLNPDYIRRFTSNSKDDLHESGATVLVTTYNMMSYSRGRSAEGQRVMKQVTNTEWGLIIMDEVHVVPARMFRMALQHVKSHCKLGLTATLVREDNLIDDLNFLIGPKLYEANWLALTDEGYLAKVLCAEVWCPMTAEFFEEYLDPNTPSSRRQLLYVMNPNKFAICQMLMKYHAAKKDKVLIFSDNIPAILRYSKYLHIYHMYGATTQNEREKVLRRFRGGRELLEGEKEINVLLISQVGDVGIDLPQANVIIQISSHFGSRRQEAQRLGRILRPKSGESFNVGWNAFFYSLISMDTAEMYFSNKRQKYLVDQGYTFKVIRNIKQIAKESGVPYEELSLEEQRAIQRDLSAEDVIEELNLASVARQEAAAAAARNRAATNLANVANVRMRKLMRQVNRR
ncbi:General transcription and DNA repair factor IIH helicase subunit XPB (TFIIH subunit XPB) (DNA excision repair protein ERCC-3) [Durusdinium trenchii]|uniref:DNA 3'-5' helicase n=1 Tax=Durusdinium trenchii TaxID=1381693 RepID=A0ABP0RN59_9DINO